VRIDGAEDIYTVTLPVEDLARLRPDLGDLRIADASDAQVPFLLEESSSEARLSLSIERTAGAGRGDGEGLSRYRLVARDRGSGEVIVLPLSRLDLQFTEPFFDRPARLFAPSPSGRRGDRLLTSLDLSRRPRALAKEASEAPPIVLSFTEVRAETLVLEIRDDDNAPLTLLRAEAVVPVPRMTFKAAPGVYRLLLDNPEARSPRYDLNNLRREMLAYSALPVEVGEASPNSAHRRRLADYLVDAPPTLLLWGILILAVIVLLGLVARIARHPPDDGLEGTGDEPVEEPSSEDAGR
jgi:hypothetical protein